MGVFSFEKRCAYLKEGQGDLQVVEIRKIPKDNIWSLKEAQNYLVFQIKGSSELDYDTKISYRMVEKGFVFIPSKREVKLKAIEDTELLIFRIFKQISLGKYYNIEYVEEKHKLVSVFEPKMTILMCSDLLTGFLEHIKAYINLGITSAHFFNLKLEELLLALKWFYSKEELTNFFSTQLSQDVSFSDYIIKNAHNYHSIGELAEAMNYSVSGFDKKFKRVFGISGYKWMQQQKAKEIYQAICFEQKTFKEIAYSFDFSSESYFYEFCKSQFGKTPGQLRKEQYIEL